MDKTSLLIKAIDTLYESVIDESRWNDALRSLSDFAGGRGTSYVQANPRSTLIVSSEMVDIDPVVNEKYLGYYASREVRLPASINSPVGQILTESMFIDTRTLRSSEIYADLLKPYDVPHIMMFWTEKTLDLCTALVIERSHSQGPFLEEDISKYALVVPHLRRAFRMRDELWKLRNQQSATMEAIYRLPFPIVFLDRAGRCVECSPSAAALLREEQGIALKSACLKAIFADDDRRLQKAILSAFRENTGNFSRGDTVVVRQRGGKRPLGINIIPIGSPEIFSATKTLAMLIISDPEKLLEPQITSVKRILKITEAEARLACRLFSGMSMREAAIHLEISVNTCKSQLKSIYLKTGCNSHVGLVKLILSSGINLRY